MNIPAMPLPTEVANFEDLLGTTIPMEVRSITHLPSHNCLIINDYFLVSFDEAYQLLKSLQPTQENTDGTQDT